MSNVTVTQVARHFADYVNRVAYRRESFTLLRGNKPLAELRPLPAGARLGELPGLIASLPRLTPSCNRPPRSSRRSIPSSGTAKSSADTGQGSCR